MFNFLQTEFDYIFPLCTLFIVMFSMEYLEQESYNCYCSNFFPQKHLFLAGLIYLFSPAFNCGELGPPTNGRLRLTNSTTVTYTCDTGYRLHGASTRHCTANGEWTESVPQCIRELRATTIHEIDSVYRLIVRLMKRGLVLRKCLNYI